MFSTGGVAGRGRLARLRGRAVALCGADNESEHEAAGGGEASASHLPWSSPALMWLRCHTHSLHPYAGAPMKDPVEVLRR